MYSDTQLAAAHLVAAALGRALGIRVVVANVPTACTDGNTIYLPPLPVTVSTQLMVMLWGFIHHEAGHSRHSDFDLVKSVNAEHDPVLANLLFVLEDVRMERAHIALYPGAHRVLSELVELLVQIGFFDAPEPDDSPAALSIGLILKSLRSSILGQTALSEQAQRHRELVERQLGRGFVTRLLAIAQEVCDCASTEETLNLAYRMREFLEDEMKQAQQPPPPAEASKPSADRQQGPTASTSSGSAQSDGSANADDSDTTESSAAADAAEPAVPDPAPTHGGSSSPPADGSPSADGPGRPSGAHPANSAANDPPGSDAAEFLESLLSGSGLSAESQDLGEALAKLINEQTEQSDDEERMVLPATVPMGSAHRDAEAVLSARQVSAKLAVQLKRQLESERRLPSVPKSSGRRVSRRHLHRVAFKDYRVFERSVLQTSVNTSVVCLLDSSGSMSWAQGSSAPIEIAREALLATMMALGSIKNLKACAGAFPARGDSERVLLLSDFEEAPLHVSSRFALNASGGTPMAEAILWGCHQLESRPADERKIILVATDGQPDRPELTAQVIRTAERSGIEVHGLGIQTDAGRSLFRSFAEVHDLSRLCEAFLELFRSVLARKRA
jgi:cobalamin biosynthesis protein CobT